MNAHLLQIIEQLYNEILNPGMQRYENGEREAKRNRELFEVVKEETKPLFKWIDDWERETLATIHNLPIMPNQVKNTKENLELFVFHSYYRDVRRKRFMEIYHSIDYVLTQMKQDHHREEE
ncbi:DUF1798 family protein [Salirhabdus sp. Marseille-P4669]|uniref:DUF1798 family protein n=1 Tax=Salirhabdus sp. Marseille-P4669 TaxID=2042310 RepID=UPI000C7D772C|nr:DUF1798 family protein [Salirhabdus sp. Marseille-P4669]